MRYARYLILCISIICFSQTASAITTLSDSSIIPAETHTDIKTHKKPVKFIAWEGNRLVTTAGTFIIYPSIQVIDQALSRKMARHFQGDAPIVELFFKDRKLAKVIIY